MTLTGVELRCSAQGLSKEFASMSVMSFITALPSFASRVPCTPPLPSSLYRSFRPRPGDIRFVQSLDISVALSLFSATLVSSFVSVIVPSCACPARVLFSTARCPAACPSVLHCSEHCTPSARSLLFV